MPLADRQVIASDSFPSSIDGNWDNGPGAWNTISHYASADIGPNATGQDCAMVRNSGSYTNKQWSTITAKTHNTTASGSTQLGAVCFGAGGSSAALYMGYLNVRSAAGGSGKYQISYINGAGSFNTLSSSGAGTFTNNTTEDDTITLEADATTGDLRLYTNEAALGGGDTQRLTANDGTLTSGTPGLGVFVNASGATTDARIKGWSGGYLGTAPGGAPWVAAYLLMLRANQ